MHSEGDDDNGADYRYQIRVIQGLSCIAGYSVGLLHMVRECFSQGARVRARSGPIFSRHSRPPLDTLDGLDQMDQDD